MNGDDEVRQVRCMTETTTEASISVACMREKMHCGRNEKEHIGDSGGYEGRD